MMSRCVCFIAVAIVFGFSCTQPSVFKAEIKIKGIDTGTAFLKLLDTDSLQKLSIKNGRVVITAPGKEPMLAILYINPQITNKSVLFFTEPARHITLEADTANPNYLKASNSPTNQELINFNQQQLNNWVQKEKSFKQMAELILQQRTTALDSLSNVYQVLKEERNNIFLQYALKNKQSYVATSLAYLNFNDNTEALKKVYDNLDNVLKQSFFGTKMQQKLGLAGAAEIGNTAPNFTLNNAEDKPVQLKDVYTANTYTLIDFWASWCGPCRAENPNVVKVYNTYKNKGFGIIGVSIDEDKEAWKRAIANDNLTWTQVIDPTDWASLTAKAYNVNGIPMNFLVDKTGKIIAKNLRGAALSKKLEELLK